MFTSLIPEFLGEPKLGSKRWVMQTLEFVRVMMHRCHCCDFEKPQVTTGQALDGIPRNHKRSVDGRSLSKGKLGSGLEQVSE